jgi:tryptophan synthase beta chain
MRPLDELCRAYEHYLQQPEFLAELDADLRDYVGRPSPIYHAERWSRELGGAQIYLKREDLNHTGAHKVNNTIGQALLAKRMGKTRIIAETGAGQHGVASATVAARLGLECVVYMGEIDVERQEANVYRMRLLGAEVVSVKSGSRTLKDALNEAMRDWVTNVDNTFYIIGTVAGPHPYPAMVRDFQAVIGRESRAQMMETGGPTAGCPGGLRRRRLAMPSASFIPSSTTRRGAVGVEAAGEGIETGHHAAPLCAGPAGRAARQPHLPDGGCGRPDHRDPFVSAGLDYPGVGPEHAWLKDSGRAQYVSVTDAEALTAFHALTRTEGIIPALESSHALAHGHQARATCAKDQHHPRQPVGPRRQGHAHGRRP